MGKLSDVDPDELREALGSVTEAKPAKRLMVALCYLDGESVATLTERFGLPRSTVYYWLDRLESQPLEQALYDDERPGRPPKLDGDQRAALAADVADGPGAYGYGAEEWTPELVRSHIAEEFDVEYSEGHVRRLLAELEERGSGG